MAKSGFNLVPKELFEEREKQRKLIDRTSLGSAFLPLVAVVAWIVVLLITRQQAANISGLEEEVNISNREIAKFEEVIERKSLLILKTRLLGDIVRLDVNPENFFNIVKDRIDASGLDIEITEYGRESSGEFFITALTDEEASIADINRIFRDDDMLSQTRIEESSQTINDLGELSEDISFTVSFIIEEPDLNVQSSGNNSATNSDTVSDSDRANSEATENSNIDNSDTLEQN